MRLLGPLVGFVLLMLFTALPGIAQEAPPETPPGEQEPRAFALAGLGLPEIVHITVGFHPTPAYSLDLRAGAIVYSPYVGLGASVYLDPRDESLFAIGLPGGGVPYLSADARYNPDYSGTLGVEEIQWAVTGSAGYRTRGTRGFFLDGRLTAWLYGGSRGVGGAASVAVGLGWAL